MLQYTIEGPRLLTLRGRIHVRLSHAIALSNERRRGNGKYIALLGDRELPNPLRLKFALLRILSNGRSVEAALDLRRRYQRLISLT